MRGPRGLALALCLQIVAANDDKTKCQGDGKKPKRQDRLTRLAAHYNGEQCKAAILAEDLPRWIALSGRDERARRLWLGGLCRWRLVRGGLPGDMPGDPGLQILHVPRRSSGQAMPHVQGRRSRPEMLHFGRSRGRPHARRMLLGTQVLSARRYGHETRWKTGDDTLVSRAARNITLFSLLPNCLEASSLCSFAASSSRGRRA